LGGGIGEGGNDEKWRKRKNARECIYMRLKMCMRAGRNKVGRDCDHFSIWSSKKKKKKKKCPPRIIFILTFRLSIGYGARGYIFKEEVTKKKRKRKKKSVCVCVCVRGQ
jgi:hypothetical protein